MHMNYHLTCPDGSPAGSTRRRAAGSVARGRPGTLWDVCSGLDVRGHSTEPSSNTCALTSSGSASRRPHLQHLVD